MLLSNAIPNVAKPAAGPLTLNGELLNAPTIIPPIMPAIIPLNGVATLAIAIPKHKGSATKKTTRPEGRSDFKLFKFIFLFLFRLSVIKIRLFVLQFQHFVSVLSL